MSSSAVLVFDKAGPAGRGRPHLGLTPEATLSCWRSSWLGRRELRGLTSCCPAPRYSPATIRGRTPGGRTSRPPDSGARGRLADGPQAEVGVGLSRGFCTRGCSDSCEEGALLVGGRSRCRQDSPGSLLCRKVGRGGGVGGPGREPCPRSQGHAGLSPTCPVSTGLAQKGLRNVC